MMFCRVRLSELVLFAYAGLFFWRTLSALCDGFAGILGNLCMLFTHPTCRTVDFSQTVSLAAAR
jgi:hypothetical protein